MKSKEKPKMELTPRRITALARTFECGSVFRLSAAGEGLARLGEAVSACEALETLDVSGNELTSLDGLEGLSRLRVVSARGNRIGSLLGFPSLPSLERLLLQGNAVASLRDVEALAGRCPGLRDLRLQEMDGADANPVCGERGYRARVAELFPALEVLDGHRVRSKHCLEGVEAPGSPGQLAAEAKGGTAAEDWLEGLCVPPRASRARDDGTAALLDECHHLAREGTRMAAAVRQQAELTK